MSENVTPGRNQRRALAALLASKTIAEAAAACRLSEKTLYRYLENPDFRQALTQAETGLIDETGRRLLTGQDKALEALEGIIKSGKDTDRRLAAVAWLDLLLKWRQAETLEARVAALEASAYENLRKTT